MLRSPIPFSTDLLLPAAKGRFLIGRVTMIVVVAFCFAFGLAAGAAAESALATDANILTALDVSDSIDEEDTLLQFQGVAEAVLNPAFLDAIQAGRNGRIGFAIFAWAAGRNLRVLVPWTVLGSPADAKQVAQQVAAAGTRLSTLERPGQDFDRPLVWYEFRTDISAAIEYGARLLAEAPYLSGRNILNICANGEDNVSTSPDTARDHAGAKGIVINAVAIRKRAGLADYLREHVQTGVDSFVLEAHELRDVADALLQKFLMEVAWPQPHHRRI